VVDLSDSIRSSTSAVPQSDSAGPLKDAIELLERRLIEEALVHCHHNQQQTARHLGLSRQGLIKKLKRYGMIPSVPARGEGPSSGPGRLPPDSNPRHARKGPKA
ncbi:MAG TPA: helix-turn-helix domain-containing protein, partial [Pirellulaceae bacterium]